MKGLLKGDKVIMGGDAIEDLYNTLYYGRLKENSLELALVEAVYLLDREKIAVEHDGKQLSFRELFIKASNAMEYFELKYIVYRDLRERGFYVQPSVTDFRVYPRGGKPNVTPARSFVHVVTERKPLPFKQIMAALQAALNVRKEMVLAIVDEESDITYYGVKMTSLKGEMPELVAPFTDKSATFLQDRVIVWDVETSKYLHENGFYGNMLDEKRLQLSLVETAYLAAKGALVVDHQDKGPLTLEEFTGYATNVEPSFEGKLKTYTDLREKGLVAKTGFKFGNHFRIYEKVETLEKIPHSRFLVEHVDMGHVFDLRNLSGSIRLANSVRKEMLFAFDKDGIQYVNIGRIKL